MRISIDKAMDRALDTLELYDKLKSIGAAENNELHLQLAIAATIIDVHIEAFRQGEASKSDD